MIITNILLLAAFAMFIANIYISVSLALLWHGIWRGAALLPIIVLIGWALSVAASGGSGHNLWPFELLLYCPGALLYLAILWGIRTTRGKTRIKGPNRLNRFEPGSANRPNSGTGF
jgi:hypothetical protein